MTLREKLFVYPSALMLPDGDLVDTFVNGSVADSEGKVTDLGETLRYLDNHACGLPAPDVVESVCVGFGCALTEGEFTTYKRKHERIGDAAFRLAQCCAVIAWIALEAP